MKHSMSLRVGDQIRCLDSLTSMTLTQNCKMSQTGDDIDQLQTDICTTDPIALNFKRYDDNVKETIEKTSHPRPFVVVPNPSYMLLLLDSVIM